MDLTKNVKRNMTPLYSVITAGFWMSYCICVAYAGEYLSKQLGYTASAYGLIMAMGSLAGAILAPVLGMLADRYRRLTPLRLVLPLIFVQAVSLIVLLLSTQKGVCFANTAAFTVYMASSIPVNTVNLKMCMDIQRAGGQLNYSLARGLGSFGFVIISTVIGILMEKVSYVWVPIGGLILVALEIPLHLLADLRLKGLKAISSENEPDIAKDAPAASSMTDFVKNNGRFCLMLIGTVLIFIAHNLDCNFLTEINNALGGTSATIGYISAFTAIVEVPVMVFFVPVFGKMRESTLMRFAFVMFVFKMLAYALSPSIPVLFAARILQAPSYALYTAATVPYVSKVIAPRDANKGQSLAFTMSTVGSIIANTFGGTMFEQLGKTQTLLIGVVITAAGAALAYIGIQKVSKNVPDAARE